MHNLIYLYILKCNDGTFYIGVTNDLERRFAEHNEGVNKKAYTYLRRPLELVYHISFTDFRLAFRTETKLKKWSHAKKQALIDGDFDLLKVLSKKNFHKE